MRIILLWSLFVLSSGSPSTFQVISSAENYKIFYPFRGSTRHQPLLSPPHVWITHYANQLHDLRHLVDIDNNITNLVSYSRDMYLHTLLKFLLADFFDFFEYSVEIKLNYTGRLSLASLDHELRQQGTDWPFFAMTMTGRARLKTVRLMLEDIIANKVPGDIVETGVWRGGMSIFMRGVLLAYKEVRRRSFVCDSFSGLPPSQYQLDEQFHWDHTPYLEISEKQVMNNFATVGIFDPEIIFVKGYFVNTMPPLSKIVTNLAMLRLDGDMYESTVDVLYHLYGKLSIGGYVIVDDYAEWFPARAACEDFFKAHKIRPIVIQPDTISGYWKKTEEIEIQYWRYREKKFKD